MEIIKKVLPYVHILLILLSFCNIFSQNVGISDNASFTPDESAILDISSTSKGLLIPRIDLQSSTDATTISNPETGLVVWNTGATLTPAGFYYNSGTSGSPIWSIVANHWDLSGSDISNNNSGNVGIGTTAPSQKLDVNGNFLVDTIFTDMILPNTSWHAFGGFEDQSVSVSITQGVWSQVTNATNDLFSGIEAVGISMSGDTMTFEHSGDYTGAVSLTFEGSNGNAYKMRVYDITAGAQEGFSTGSTGNGAGNYVTMTKPLYFEVTAGDKFILQITNIDGNNSATLVFSTFYINFLHR